MEKKDISKIILGTGYYDNVLSGNGVSIEKNNYDGKIYSKVAPLEDTVLAYNEDIEKLRKLRYKISELEYKFYKNKVEDEYIKSYYKTILKDLNLKALMYTIKNKYGEDAILLTSEGIDEFSYRRLLADYIELKTGIYIPEVSISNEGKVKKISPIRYKNRLNGVIKKNG